MSLTSSLAAVPAAAPRSADLAERYAAVRGQTESLAAPLSEADCQVQSMPDASPVKWHLAHVTWFFETFVLERHGPGFRPFDASFRVLFNSYYNGVGDQHPRAQRGLITRPGLATVLAYRRAVDERMAALLTGPHGPEVAMLVELGLQHEQQHQELLLTDVLHLLSCNPLAPVYRLDAAAPAGRCMATPAAAQAWLPQPGGQVHLGHAGAGFAFDNESPRHAQLLQPHALARRLTTQDEWLAFMADGGYAEPRWWMSAGWDWVRSQRIGAPLYWRHGGRAGDSHDTGGAAARWQQYRPQDWQQFSLQGLQPLDLQAPVAHISWFEADAFARWWSAQHPGQPPARVPTEAEWEHAAQVHEAPSRAAGNFLESGALRPLPAAGQATNGGVPLQLLGDVWEWTASPYTRLPGLPGLGRCGGRIQRQIHGQPDGVAWWLLRHTGQPHSAELPQLLPHRHALAVLRPAPGA